MFGYDSTLTWKIADIRPSDAPGLAKVTIVVSSPQGQQVSVLYVTSDGQHALTGELIPFGFGRSTADRKQLEKGLRPRPWPSERPSDDR